MNIAEKLVARDGFSSAAERRKRLGQYFTGTSLGRILAALAEASSASSIVDPMSGSGDLLAACVELGAKPLYFGAVEIDPIAHGVCSKRFPGASCISGSAFDPATLLQLPILEWDLVITNPPYVRYQSTSKCAGNHIHLPSAVEIRKGLLSALEILPALDHTDRVLFRHLAGGYSGLADIALPSWILCAALVAPGGRLALVVPESWLSRDYASVAHYILHRWFDIEFIVEDEHAAWFSDVQVKTTLLVAKRVPRKQNAFDLSGCATFLRIAISGNASGPRGPCSQLRQGAKVPAKAFAKEARKWLVSGASHDDEMVTAFHVPLARTAANLQGVCAKQKWFGLLGESVGKDQLTIPHELDLWLSRGAKPASPVALLSLGVSVGQGLRTGANQFFYAEGDCDVDGTCLLFNKSLYNRRVKVSDDIALPVVRRQSDLPKGFVIESETLKGKVLDLRHHALPEDIRAGGAEAASAYDRMPKELADFVRAAALVNIGTKDDPRKVWELSAVAPNIRKGNLVAGTPPRFWYMLPDFAPRHTPDLLMARVNSSGPKAFLNKGRKALIDANFSTLWINAGGACDANALLALLNSCWISAALELTAAVMGGGALKVEASHLRRLPVPNLDAKGTKRLSVLGRRLANASNHRTITLTLEEIDRMVVEALLGRRASEKDIASLKDLAATGQGKRRQHKNKKRAT